MHRLILGALFLNVVLSPCARAGAPEPIDPALALAEVRDAYRAGPVAERVRVTIHPDGKPAWHDEFVVRLDAGKAKDRSGASLGLEMGDLRVWASAGRVIGAHQRDQKSCFVSEYAGPLTPGALSQALPPIPVPQLAFMTLDPEADSPLLGRDLTPYTPLIVWEAAAADDSAGAALLSIRGHTAPSITRPTAGKVLLAADLKTGRLIRFTADLEQGAQLTLDFEALSPGDPGAWAIDAEGRARVAHINDLKPRPGDVTVGKAVPDMLLSDIQTKPWNLLTAFSVPRGEPESSAADFLVLLLVCEPREADAPKDPAPPPVPAALDDAAAGDLAIRAVTARLDRERLLRTAGDHALLPPKVAARTVFIVRKADSRAPAKVKAASARWGDGLLWSASRETTIDRFTPGDDTAIIVIRPDRTLAGIIALAGRAAKQNEIESELSAVVSGAVDAAPGK